jgi:ribosomal protein S18 acetylase RimI-like enzyme
MQVTYAGVEDISRLVTLLNRGYRGNESKKGWTTEAGLFNGDKRTDESVLLERMKDPQAVFLKYTNPEGEIEGCVFLRQEKTKLYLGMLCVSPDAQARGTGKLLLQKAEEHARYLHCTSIYMQVISARQELICWYERRGYQKTGETAPFPDDPRFGIPTQPLEFIILEKNV